MRKLILDRRIVDDAVQYVATGEPVPAQGDVLLPLDAFLADAGALLARRDRIGVRIEPGQGVADLVPFLDRLAIIAVSFPTHADGRGFSYARELRERHGFRGEIRAVGDVQRDQLQFLHRCGVNAFDVRADRSIEDALKGMDDFHTGYQGDVHDPRPLYRRG